MNSILTCVKQILGIHEDDTSFDLELVIHINTAIAVLTQLGVGPETGYKITGNTEQWDTLVMGRNDLDNIKLEVYLRCRLSFDPPQNSFLVKSIEDQLKELDWRIEVATSPNGE